MLFRFLIMVHVCAAFPLKCPEPAQWSLRARSLCPDPSKYFCLRNDLINGYSENCTVFDFLQPGRKNVLRGGLDADVCSSDRYQPWPLTYYTNVSTNCIFLKATCNEEGQVVHDKGNRNTDITCKCDYTKGYDFLVKPRNPCFCIPSEEDCSCFLKTCPNSTFKLSPDYECIHLRMNIAMSQCRSIMNGRENRDEKQSKQMYTSRKDNITEPVLWKIYAWISTFVVCIIYVGLIFAVCANGLLDKYYHKACLIRNPPASLTFVEGQTMHLTYKLLINRFVVVFKRNDDVIGEDGHNNEIEPGRSKTLTIQHITLNDGGEYYLEALGLKCRRTMVTVKPMFKLPLEKVTIVEGSVAMFECETEEENSPVEWLKDGKTINDKAKNIKIESFQEYFYKLMITSTSLQDIGTYSILKNGIYSKAVLEVKALFKRPLEPLTSVEGSDVQFECETEEDDSSSVQWFKDNIPVTFGTGNLKMEILTGHIYKLIISRACLHDSGIYRIEKNGICSEAGLNVKAMFKTPLTNVIIMEGLDTIFECELEAGVSSVEWFKDDFQLPQYTEHIKQEVLSGEKYKLTIAHTCLKDGGKYSIRRNDIKSNAELIVKEMPDTIKQMSELDRQQFLEATKSGTTKRYYIRVMIIGEGSAGKTCLLRRLMNQSVDGVRSTDGIDIERQQCQIDVKTGEWFFSTDLSKPSESSKSSTAVDDKHYTSWSIHNEQFANCGFWDFAGQKEFYATHQTFLSANAVYLLAVDISKDFTTRTYNGMIETDFNSIGEYIDFWLDNIHCYSKDVPGILSQQRDKSELNPPVIIVGTRIDKYQSSERDQRMKCFKDHLETILCNHAKRRHIRKTHFLSNTLPSDNHQEFVSLRKDIFERAQSLKNWGDNLPTRWIVLEKEIHRQITNNKFTLTYSEAVDLATTCSFSCSNDATSELDSFLRYEHDIGNIIFFDDVKQFIVLEPKWLVDVFKCFVSHQYKDELMHMTEWSELKRTGKLLDNLITELLKKVPHFSLKKHKDFVLKIMAKFDIIVQPLNADTTESLYMPCMITAVKLENIISELDAGACKKTSWFCLEFDFLPPSYFNHILVCFMREKKLQTKKDNQLCIYRNIGVFNINEQGTQVLIICLSKNVIGMQVLQWNDEQIRCTDYKNKLIELVISTTERYRINITYKKKFKCSDGCFYDEKGRVDYDIVAKYDDYRCTEHNIKHSSKEIYDTWLKEEIAKEVKDDMKGEKVRPVLQKYTRTEHQNESQNNKISPEETVETLCIIIGLLEQLLNNKEFDEIFQEELSAACPNYMDVLQTFKRDLISTDCSVIIAGETNAGKTTLINQLIGKDVFFTTNLPATGPVCRIRNSNSLFVQIYSGDESFIEEKKALDLYELKALLKQYTGFRKHPPEMIDVYLPVPLLKGNVIIVDTPGIGETASLDNILLNCAMHTVSVVFMVNACNAGGIHTDRLLRIFKTVNENRKQMPSFDPDDVIFLTNQWDIIMNKKENWEEEDQHAQIMNLIHRQLEKGWPCFHIDRLFKISLKQVRIRQKTHFTKEFEIFKLMLGKTIERNKNKRREYLFRFVQRFAVNAEMGIASRMHLLNKSEDDRRITILKNEKRLWQLQAISHEKMKEATTYKSEVITKLANQFVHYFTSDCGRSEILNPPGTKNIITVPLVSFTDEVFTRINIGISKWCEGIDVQEIESKMKNILSDVELMIHEIEKDLIGIDRSIHDVLLADFTRSSLQRTLLSNVAEFLKSDLHVRLLQENFSQRGGNNRAHEMYDQMLSILSYDHILSRFEESFGLEYDAIITRLFEYEIPKKIEVVKLMINNLHDELLDDKKKNKSFVKLNALVQDINSRIQQFEEVTQLKCY